MNEYQQIEALTEQNRQLLEQNRQLLAILEDNRASHLPLPDKKPVKGAKHTLKDTLTAFAFQQLKKQPELQRIFLSKIQKLK